MSSATRRSSPVVSIAFLWRSSICDSAVPRCGYHRAGSHGSNRRGAHLGDVLGAVKRDIGQHERRRVGVDARPARLRQGLAPAIETTTATKADESPGVCAIQRSVPKIGGMVHGKPFAVRDLHALTLFGPRKP